MDKIINCKCICEKVIIWTNDQTIILDPCEHIIHRKCMKDKSICPMCNTTVTKYYSEKDLKKLCETDKKYYQKYVDIISIKNPSYLTKTDMNKVISKMPKLIDLITKFMTLKGFDKTKELSEHMMTMLNTKLIVHGQDNISTQRKIIISNHSSIVDHMVISYLFRCGFLSSVAILKSYFGRLVTGIVPLLLLDRTKKENTVDRMKEYVSNVESLCLYPEGMITHPDTILRFRTGAFHTGHPIQPVVIKYDPVAYDSGIDANVNKLLSADELTIEVFVLPLEYPPFTPDKIEKIRRKMAKAGNMALSRVSNRDINENIN